MKIKEFIIMPSSIDTLGLVHKPGRGPNNRFDFKNKGNNKANELSKEEAAGVGIITKQNATKDAPIGSEYANMKKLGLGKKPKMYGENFADKGKIDPVLSMWLPNIVMGAFGILLCYFHSREKSFYNINIFKRKS